MKDKKKGRTPQQQPPPPLHTERMRRKISSGCSLFSKRRITHLSIIRFVASSSFIDGGAVAVSSSCTTNTNADVSNGCSKRHGEEGGGVTLIAGSVERTITSVPAEVAESGRRVADAARPGAEGSEKEGVCSSSKR